jgi:hypothetical protein
VENIDSKLKTIWVVSYVYQRQGFKVKSFQAAHQKLSKLNRFKDKNISLLQEMT